MKLIFREYLSLALVLISLSACVKESIPGNEQTGEFLNELTVNFECGQGSKMDFTADAYGAHFSWTDGDIIYLMPNNSSTKSYLYSYDYESGKFVSEDPAPALAAGYFVAYSKFGKVSNAGGKAQFTIEPKSYSIAALPMISEVATGSVFALHHVFGLLEVPLYSSVSSMSFYRASITTSSNFTGTFEVAPSTTPGVNFKSGANSFPVYGTSDSFALPSSSSSAKSIFVPMAPGVYPGVSFEVLARKDKLLYKTEKSSSNTLSITRGKITKAGKVQVTASSKYTPKPASATNNVVAHRGGSKECGFGDNTLASVKYAMGLGCYGVELDVYITKDDKVIVGHGTTTDDGKNVLINGLVPSNSTFAELKAAGQMPNGEPMHQLEEYLQLIVDERYCTRMILDVKLVKVAGSYKNDLVEECAKKCCDIAAEYGATNFMEMLLTSSVSKTNYSNVKTYALGKGIEFIGVNNLSATTAKDWGAIFANVCAKNMSSSAGGSGTYTAAGYANKGVLCSVFNVDKMESGDDNAVYNSTAWNHYKNNRSSYHTICSNYPNWFINYCGIATDETEFSGGSGTASDPYIIATPADFARFAGKTNSKTTYQDYSDKHYRQIANLDLNGYTLVPICNAKDRAFTGVYDGCGHKIYNYVQTRTQDNVGFWSWVSGGQVKNLVIGSKDGKNWDGVSTITMTDASDNGSEWHYIGTFCRIVGSAASKAKLTNVKSFIKFNITSSVNVKMRMAGLCAQANTYSEVTSCEYYGTIIHTPKPSCAFEQLVGGVVATVEGPNTTIDLCKNYGSLFTNHYKTTAIAGVVGNSPSSTGTQLIKNCDNYGDIEHAGVDASNAMLSVGGVLGYMNGPTANTYENCTNYGKVTASGSAMAGGILGRPGAMPVTLRKCKNYGTVQCASGENDYGERYVGGIVAWIANTSEPALSIIDDCHNYGTVQTNGETLMMGGIAGRVAWTQIKNCTNEGTVRYEADVEESQARNCNIGGIVGEAYTNSTVTNCENKGAIYSNKVGTNRLGGIAGTINASSISSCSNTAIVQIELSSPSTKWSNAGGIVALIDNGTCAVSNCSVSGDGVKAELMDSEINGVGGIVGLCQTAATITNNANSANVYSTIDGGGGLFVGGILGAVRNVPMTAFSDNANTGNVYGEHIDSSTSLCVGGIIGRHEISTCATGNKSLNASVNGINAAGSGAAVGAVCGWNESDASIALISNSTVSGSVKGHNLDTSNVETYKCGNAAGKDGVVGTVYNDLF